MGEQTSELHTLIYFEHFPAFLSFADIFGFSFMFRKVPLVRVRRKQNSGEHKPA